MQRSPRLLALAASLILAALLLGACAGVGRSTLPAGLDQEAGLRLRILHINDHHSRLAPDREQILLVEGQPVEFELGGFPRVVAAFRQFDDGERELLKLHAGDAMTGDLYFTLFGGEADADLMNQICFDAFAIGNHEFDAGDAGLKRFLDFLSKRTWSCATPALGANIRPALGSSPLAHFSGTDYILPSVTVERGGQRIGIVGVDIRGKTMSASSPDAGTVLLDEYESAQAEIDRLRADGVAIIILLSHIGYHNDRDLARRLSGVDLIVGGDSHSLLGENFHALGLKPDGPYPTLSRNADGDPVCIVQAWQYSWAVGRLDVDFDASGRVRHCQGEAVLLLGDRFSRNGAELGDAEHDRIERWVDASPQLLRIEPDPEAQRILDHYRTQIERFSTEALAEAPERLCLRRLPGRRDRSRDPTPGCAEATDKQGGHVQMLVAQAFLQQAQGYGGADIVLQNAGGVRNAIPAGTVTVGDVHRALPFRNTLLRLQLSGAEIRAVLESAIEHVLADPGAHNGGWPYAAGLRWHVDLKRSAEQGRSHGHQVWREGGWQELDDDALYAVIANDYIGAGRDGYGPLAELPPERRGDTILEYAQAMIDYLRAGGSLQRPGPEQWSLRSLRE